MKAAAIHVGSRPLNHYFMVYDHSDWIIWA